VSFQSTKCVFGSHVFFEQATKFEWSEVDVPDTVIDFFETDIFTREKREGQACIIVL